MFVCYGFFGWLCLIFFFLITLPYPCTQIIYLTKQNKGHLASGRNSLITDQSAHSMANPIGTLPIFTSRPQGTKFSWVKRKRKENKTQTQQSNTNPKTPEGKTLEKLQVHLFNNTQNSSQWANISSQSTGKIARKGTEKKARGHIMVLQCSRNN